MPKKKNQRKKPKKQQKVNKSIKQIQREAAEYAFRKTPNMSPAAHIIQDECMREYNAKLVEKGYGFSRRELKSMNLFDIRAITKPAKNSYNIPEITVTDEMFEYLDETDWMSVIPCFSEGVIQFNSDRYVYYKVENIDVNNQTLVMTVQDYIAYESYWEVGVHGTLMLNFYEKNGKSMFDVNRVISEEHPYRFFTDIYKLISPDELGWSQEKCIAWTATMTYAEFVQKKMLEMKEDSIKGLMSCVTRAITVINFYLAKNKPSRPIKNSRLTRKIEKKIGEVTNKEKSVRKVGVITIKSEKPPKIITKDSVIRYKTPSWKKRSTIRTLKSGKKVFVKESICHRHCLQEKATEPSNVNIVLTKPKRGDQLD